MINTSVCSPDFIDSAYRVPCFVMRLSQPASASSSRRCKLNRLGARGRKKHKRLDSICENAFNRNHGIEIETSRGINGREPVENGSELRRSTRVRRAPLTLDVSPPPAKKRRKIVRNGERNRRSLGRGTKKADLNKCDFSIPCSSSGESDEALGVWKSRLRSRVSSSTHQVKEEQVSRCGKRRLYKDLDEVEQKLEDRLEDDLTEEEEVDGRKSRIMKSTRPGRVRASVDCETEFHGESVDDQPKLGIDIAVNNSDVDEKLCDEAENVQKGGTDMLLNKGDGDEKILLSRMNCTNVAELVDFCVASPLIEKFKEISSGPHLEDNHISGEAAEANDKILEAAERLDDASKESDCPLLEDGSKQIGTLCIDNTSKQSVSLLVEDASKLSKTPLVEDASKQADSVGDVNLCTSNVPEPKVYIDGESDALSLPQEKPLEGEGGPEKQKSTIPNSVYGKRHIKEGRRCGLCGGGTDGKPPKRLVQDTAGNDHEAYSGSSGSEEPYYDVWDGFGEEPGWLGRLLGPINDRFGIAGIWVHQQCAVWSPEVYFADLGHLKNVRAALFRGKALKCTRCGRPGATTGCRVDRCPKTYHLPCARASRCIFDHRKFLIACTDHRHLFQPYGYDYIQRMKKLKAKKMKLETRKLSNDAWRRDIEAEEKWLEKCGEDEEFLKRESKRLQRDMVRIAPVYIGGSHSEGEKLFEGWESVAGLQDVIRCMKEVVILPLLYPEFFSNLGLTPPRGVLLHGYPGTGKTLVVRALIGSCARGDRRIAYFARKGADCLGKYVGDAERQLRLLFQVAEKSQPSIIFFDEIDGLAPVRTRQQDQTHSSVVSTLLALMDGLKSRGSVIVIGATNRPDAVDPALRRPGRFDREIYFPLPSVKDRAAILALHTRRWPKPLDGSLLDWIARKTTGFSGADLQALCTHAAITALKRSCPLQKILSDAGRRDFDGRRPQLPSFAVNERDWLEALLSAPSPCSRREAGMAANEISGSPLCLHLVPCLLQPLSSLLVSLYLDDRIWLPPPLYNAARSIKNVIVSALEKKLHHVDEWWAHVHDLVLESDIASKIVGDLSIIGILVGDTALECYDLSHDSSDDSKSRIGAWDDDSFLFGGPANYSIQRKNAGYRILIAGNPRSGQRHLASCLLQCFVGNVEIQKIDMATISQEGHGDIVQGVAQILMRCASVKSCAVFLPRIDLWALEESEISTAGQTSNEDDSYCADGQTNGANNYGNCLEKFDSVGETELQEEEKCASGAWKSFINQFESICVSTSFIVLATSEVPYPELPMEVRQFFEGGPLCSKGSVSSQHMVPRITLELDGKFNRDKMTHSSVSELCWDLIRQLIQLIHHRIHPLHESSVSFIGQFEGEKHMPNHNLDHISMEESKSGGQCPDDAVRAAAPSNSKIMRGKSNLLMAISSFGYQILTYPHFAQLCWVTSKLKEGPCADVRGPWKGWPFNSCIVRPSDAPDKDVVASANKGQRQFISVRGLIAVGLSAYRGVYTSLSVVSMEVRKVLELLVGKINAKVQVGRDRCQFVCLLSQVAYLDDVVNNWVHSFRSLELDAQMMGVDPSAPLSDLVSADKKQGLLDSLAQIVGEASVLSKDLLQSVSSERSIGKIADGDMEAGHLDKEIVNLDAGKQREVSNVKEHALKEVYLPGLHFPVNSKFKAGPTNTEQERSERLALESLMSSDNYREEPINPEKESSRKVALEGCHSSDHDFEQEHINPEKEPQGAVMQGDPRCCDCVQSPVVDQSCGMTSIEETGAKSEAFMPKNHEDVQVAEGTFDTTEVNGFAIKESFVSDDFGGPKLLWSNNGCNLPDTSTFVENGAFVDEAELNSEMDNLCSKRSSHLSQNSGLVCSCSFCFDCIDALHQSVQNVIDMEWERSGGSLTVEDAHDLVGTLSTSLCSAVRKLYVDEGFSQKHVSLFESLATDGCKCTISESKSLVPRECTCHLGKGTSNRVNRLGFGSRFIYRDGVLVQADSVKDVPIHCKYENLCLCPLRDLIAITRSP